MKSLSSTFAHLDSGSQRPDVKMQRQAQWTDLEDALFDWQQIIEQKKATVTGDILKEVAATLWEKIPRYADQEMPKFSTGWLDGFKARHNIKKYRRHGEAGAIDMEVVEEELQEIREVANPDTNGDVYNMDESALFLFWKMKGLLAQSKGPEESMMKLVSLSTLLAMSLDLTSSSFSLMGKLRYHVDLDDNTSILRISGWYGGTTRKPG